MDGTKGLNDVRSDIALMLTPDGGSKPELSKFHRPPAIHTQQQPANTLGIGRMMFAVQILGRSLAASWPTGRPSSGLTTYEDKYRLRYIRGPKGIMIALAEKLN